MGFLDGSVTVMGGEQALAGCASQPTIGDDQAVGDTVGDDADADIADHPSLVRTLCTAFVHGMSALAGVLFIKRFGANLARGHCDLRK